MVVVILAPEVGVGLAIQQWACARQALAFAKQEFPMEELSMTHLFYANMAGFAVTKRKNKSESSSAPLVGSQPKDMLFRLAPLKLTREQNLSYYG
jgi:hypothetical protein